MRLFYHNFQKMKRISNKKYFIQFRKIKSVNKLKIQDYIEKNVDESLTKKVKNDMHQLK